jgi:hypothetical protein
LGLWRDGADAVVATSKLADRTPAAALPRWNQRSPVAAPAGALHVEVAAWRAERVGDGAVEAGQIGHGEATCSTSIRTSSPRTARRGTLVFKSGHGASGFAVAT